MFGRAVIIIPLTMFLACAPAVDGAPSSHVDDDDQSGRVVVTSGRSCDDPASAPDPQRWEQAWDLGRVQGDLRAVHAFVHEASGPRDDAPLTDGFIGTALDHDQQQAVVVLDPDGQLDADEVASHLEGRTDQLSIRIEHGCRSADQLRRIAAEITGDELRGRHGNPPLVAGIDPATSRVRVHLGRDGESFGEEVEDRFGDAVAVHVDPTDAGPMLLPGVEPASR